MYTGPLGGRRAFQDRRTDGVGVRVRLVLAPRARDMWSNQSRAK